MATAVPWHWWERAAQNAPGQPPGPEKAAIQGWLGQEPGDERQEPCTPQRKEPLRGLHGAKLPGWEALLAHQGGGGPGKED